jgi:hypothetical protein
MSRHAVIAALSLSLEACGPACPETWFAEEVEWPMGERGGSFRDDPGTLLAVLGPVSEPAGGHVVYANILVLPPPEAERGSTGGPSPGGCSKQASTLIRKAGAESLAFTYEYAGVSKELTMAGQRWSTRTSNTFVVTFDRERHPQIRALNIFVRSDAPETVLAAIQTQLPTDPRVARLRLGGPKLALDLLDGGRTPQNNALERTRRVGVPASRAVFRVSPRRSTQCWAVPLWCDGSL